MGTVTGLAMADKRRENKALEINLPSDYRRRRAILKPKTVILATAASMLLLTVCQEPIGWSIVAWIALAPWVVAVASGKSTKQTLVITYAFALIYFLGNLYWLANVTMPGYAALCFYLAWYFPITGYLLRRIYLRRRWPFTVVLPVVWVGQEYARAIIMTGFPWLFISHSQHESYRLIQLCDLVGTYGVTFLIAMVNGLVCDMLLRPLKSSPPPMKNSSQSKPNRTLTLTTAKLAMVVAIIIVAAIIYGNYRINQTPKTTTQGPTITLVQENIPQFVKEQGQSNEQIFTKHLRLSNEALLADTKPQLIVWPETMVPGPINLQFIDVVIPPDLREKYKMRIECQSYHSRLQELARDNAAILVGSSSIEFAAQGPKYNAYNSAILYLQNGQRYGKRYDKMHLVPFGEVVPFKDSWPWLHELLNKLTPYDYDYTLAAGHTPLAFEFTAKTKPIQHIERQAGDTYRFAVAICYEDVISRVVRKLTASENGEKRVDFLVNISNDGWFVNAGQGKPTRSTSEQIQHLVQCKFRAIENRVPIARAVNTGISCFITSVGKTQEIGLEGTLPHDPKRRQAVAGFITDTIEPDSRLTLYSKIGDTFAIANTILAILLLIATRKKKKRK